MTRRRPGRYYGGSLLVPILVEAALTLTPAGVDHHQVEFQGDELLAQIARELVGVMRRDIKLDWTVRDDFKASCGRRSSGSL